MGAVEVDSAPQTASIDTTDKSLLSVKTTSVSQSEKSGSSDVTTSPAPSVSSSSDVKQNTDVSDAAPQDEAGDVQETSSSVPPLDDTTNETSSKDFDLLNPTIFKDKKGVAMPITIDLDNLEQSQNKSSKTGDAKTLPLDDSIVWETLVYPHEKSFSSCAVARYLTFKPAKQLKVSSKQDSTSTDDSSDKSAGWKGPVIKMRYQAKARMPWLDTNVTTNEYDCDCSSCQERREKDGAPKPLIYNQDEVPRLPQNHDITFCSHPKLVIKSPHLYMALRDTIEHCPGYFAPSTMKLFGEATINYPYALIFHNFPRLDDLASCATSKPIDRPQNTPEDEDSVAQPTEPVFEKDPVLAKEHLGILQKYLKPTYESKVMPLQKALKEGSTKVAFDMLWYVFRPGTLVYVRDEWTPFYTAMINAIDFRDDSSYWSVSVWVLSTDGARIGRYEPSALTIYSYEGTKDVTSLDICPADMWDAKHGDARRKEATQRGKLLEKACRKGHLLADYTSSDGSADLGHGGKVVVDHRRGQDMTGLSLKYVGIPDEDKDRYSKYDDIYVNEPWNWGPESLILKNTQKKGTDPHNSSGDDPGDSVKEQDQRRVLPLTAAKADDVYTTRWSSTTRRDEPLSEPLTDQQLMLLYPLTFGFSLKTKIWLELDASRLEETTRAEDSLKNLVLAEDAMQTIQAIASRLQKPDTWSADHIEGKGSGGIILLHGPPGVGKTFTVECIAEVLERPLLALTVADIGTAETMIERELSRWFALADLWKAVLLIDEADIFLEKREVKDLQRNGLVSAFLRRAEYFNGLLFLTTNRVGQIDDAFISRIHVPIHYAQLSGEALANIWAGFFRKLQRDRSVRVQVSPKAKKWVMEEFKKGSYHGLNGRDIRNALQTAITLAEFEYEQEKDFDAARDIVVVEQEHFLKVLNMSHQFRAYVDSIRRDDEHKRAQSRGDRNDFEEKNLSVRGSSKSKDGSRGAT